MVGNGIYRRARERDIFPSLSLLFLGLTIPFLGVFFHFLGLIFLLTEETEEEKKGFGTDTPNPDEPSDHPSSSAG